LGVGDLSSRGSPNLVKMPATVNIAMIAAGSHHTVVLTSDGDVLTWGAHLVKTSVIKLFSQNQILSKFSFSFNTCIHCRKAS
jgi:alpha-tubulin suppressor-like RCC1 family protein